MVTWYYCHQLDHDTRDCRSFTVTGYAWSAICLEVRNSGLKYHIFIFLNFPLRPRIFCWIPKRHTHSDDPMVLLSSALDMEGSSCAWKNIPTRLIFCSNEKAPDLPHGQSSASKGSSPSPCPHSAHRVLFGFPIGYERVWKKGWRNGYI